MEKKEIVKVTSRELFSKKGYKKVSMDEIALKSGVTKRTIYSYFKDKDELFGLFIIEELEKMKHIVEKIECKNISFIDKIHETIFSLLKYKKDSEFLTTIGNEAIEIKNSVSNNYIKLIDDNIKNYIKEKLEIAINNNFIKKCDIDFCTFVIYKIYLSVLFEWDNSLNEKQISDNITKILKFGILN